MPKMTLLMVFTIALLAGCNKEEEMDINIRVRNVSDVKYTMLDITGYAPPLLFLNIAPGSTSEYQSYSSRLMPDTYFLTTPVDTLNVIYEFVSVGSGLENGFYPMELNKVELINFVKD